MPARTQTHLATAIALLALVVALGGTAVAATAAKNSVTSKSIKDNAVKSKDVKNNALTGTDIKESSLAGINAKSVGGVSITPVSVSSSNDDQIHTVLQENGITIKVYCQASDSVRFYGDRDAGAPPLTFEWATFGGSVSMSYFAPATDGISGPMDAGHLRAAILYLDGRSTRLDLAAVFEENSAGGTDDCFYRGTITRTP